MTLGDESRTAIKARDANKKRASKLKKSRRKYKKLADEKEGTAGSDREELAGSNTGTDGTVDEDISERIKSFGVSRAEEGRCNG
jgi:hypothetical protein